jgi:acetyl esterase
MPTRHAAHAALTPAMAQLLARIWRARRPPFHTLSPQAARAAYERAAAVLEPPRAALPVVRDLDVPGGDGRPLRARLYRPSAVGMLPALLYLHGGGFVVGSLETHDSLCRQLALRSGGAVLALDYRLAPEHPFPAAVDDTWAALHWLHGAAPSLNVDPARLAVGGDSAGGTLATVAAMRARDARLPLRLQLLITPGTAATPDSDAYRRYGEGFLLDAVTVEWFFEQVLPRAQRHDWRFAPIEAPDLDHVAPTCVILAECDPVVDEGLAYADRLRMAGVPVRLELFRGVTHDFIKMGRALPEAALAQQAAADALKEAWHG